MDKAPLTLQPAWPGNHLQLDHLETGLITTSEWDMNCRWARKMPRRLLLHPSS